MQTTLNKIRAHSPCTHGWEKLLTYLGKTKADDEPLSLLTIIDSNGIDDALWCLQAVEGHDKEIRLFAVWCARQVQHLMTDKRSIDALDVAERYAKGEATAAELAAVTEAAAAVTEAAGAVTEAAGAAADATEWAAADATEWAAWDAARAARYAADAAWAAADATEWSAAWDAARAARYAADAAMRDARAKQEAELRRICGEVEG